MVLARMRQRMRMGQEEIRPRLSVEGLMRVMAGGGR